MSREDLYRIAGINSEIGIAHPEHITQIAQILYRRAKNHEIGFCHCQKVAAQFLANFDHRYRKNRKSLLGVDRERINV
jgi:hypothetical protein